MSSSQPLVQLADVTFGYGERVILDGITLSVPRGQVTALMGASGGGKTTIISLLQRFYEVDSGRILVDGQDIARVDLRSLREKIAFVDSEIDTVQRGHGGAAINFAQALDFNKMAHAALLRASIIEAEVAVAIKRGAAKPAEFSLGTPRKADLPTRLERSPPTMAPRSMR